MNTYDVVIIGGGTAGCSCAYNCGKLGLKTLLIEKGGCLGGTMTSGLVVPVMKTGTNLINTDFYNDLISNMKLSGGQITYQDNPGWFNPELMKIVLDKMLLDAGVEILFNTEVVDFEKFAKKLTSIYIHAGSINELLSVNTDTIHVDNISDKQYKLSVCIGA